MLRLPPPCLSHHAHAENQLGAFLPYSSLLPNTKYLSLHHHYFPQTPKSFILEYLPSSLLGSGSSSLHLKTTLSIPSTQVKAPGTASPFPLGWRAAQPTRRRRPLHGDKILYELSILAKSRVWKYNVQFTLTGPTPTWAFRSRSRVGRPPCPSWHVSGPLGTTNQFPLDHTGSANYPVTRLCLLNCPRAGTVMESYDRNPFDFEMWCTKNINKAAIPYIKPEFLAENTFLAHGISSALNTRVFLRLVWLPVQPQRARRKRKGRKQWGSAAVNKHSHAETGKKDPPGGRTENYSCATNATQIHSSWIF